MVAAPTTLPDRPIDHALPVRRILGDNHETSKRQQSKIFAAIIVIGYVASAVLESYIERRATTYNEVPLMKLSEANFVAGRSSHDVRSGRSTSAVVDARQVRSWIRRGKQFPFTPGSEFP